MNLYLTSDAYTSEEPEGDPIANHGEKPETSNLWHLSVMLCALDMLHPERPKYIITGITA